MVFLVFSRSLSLQRKLQYYAVNFTAKHTKNTQRTQSFCKGDKVRKDFHVETRFFTAKFYFNTKYTNYTQSSQRFDKEDKGHKAYRQNSVSFDKVNKEKNLATFAV